MRRQYKIDLNPHSPGYLPYGLYIKRRWWFGWSMIDTFESLEKAQASFEQLSALPIYLEPSHAV